MNATEYQLARTVPLNSMRRYLQLHHWRKSEKTHLGVSVFQAPDADVYIVLPQYSDRLALPSSAAETFRRVGDALRILSQLCATDIRQVAADVRAVSLDILRAVVPDTLVRNESICLEVASEFVKTVKKLLSAAATTELSPDRFFDRTRKEAKKYADECRFGHTFRGSFGFTIESPISLNDSPNLVGITDEKPPFERLVMQRMVRGLHNVQTALTEQDSTPIFENFKSGLSANMCEELVDVVGAAKGERMRFEFALSPEWRVPSDIQPGSSYDLAANHIELIQDAARRLRLQEFERHRLVTGRIVRLKYDRNPSDLSDGGGKREIIIHWISDDFGEIQVELQLQPDEYLQAVEAHKTGRPVCVQGDIDRKGRSWILSSPSDFALLP